MKKRIIFILLFATIFLVGFASKPYKVVFYNLENLFDTINDPDVADEEFTPSGSKKWTGVKYHKKIKNVERVFFDMAALDKNYPAVIGVSEIENRSVLEDVIATPKLSPANYRIVHYDSPERRGVDVAFMYRPDIFKLEGSFPVRVVMPDIPDYKTRDIVTMWGTIDGEPFYFMVGHWSSRIGGKSASEFRRVVVGAQMKSLADSVLKANPATKIIAMGDFNDDPTDKSVEEALGAKGRLRDVKVGDFFNPFYEMFKDGYGTLAYRDAWNLFDNIVVSQTLVDGDGLRLNRSETSEYYGNIFKQFYMLQREGNFKGYPLRTYTGNSFKGGFSDHLPVYIYIAK